MKKYLLIIFILVGGWLHGQRITMGIHLTMNQATQNTEPLASPFRLGGGMDMDFLVTPNFSLGPEIHYLGYIFGSNANIDPTVTILPFQGVVKLRWRVSPDFETYVGTGGGLFYQRYRSRGQVEAEVSPWGITPRIGLRYQFAQDVYLDVNLLYYQMLTEANRDNITGVTTLSIGLSYNILAEL